jgi:xylan 1,4-beta-xylosidase
MRNLLSRRNFIKTTSTGLAGTAALPAIGSTSLLFGPDSRKAYASQPELYRTITVDAGKVIGTIRDLQGINLGPLSSSSNRDYSKEYRDMKISLVRNHDFGGPTDIDGSRYGTSLDGIIFPDWDADPEKEESYVFGPSDRIIKGIIECGANVYYRLGRTFRTDPTPPPDFDKFANVCKHIVMHYIEGWANGFHFNIPYWELWNEPNIQPIWRPGDNFPIPWGAPAIKFFQLYEKVARTLKSYNSNLKVGACGLAEGQRESYFREGFIRYCADNQVPLDFFSWHFYPTESHDPYDLVRISRVVRDVLDSNGFQNAENHCTEWNGVLTDWNKRFEMNPAAFTASALIYAQDALDVSIIYSINGMFSSGDTLSYGSSYTKAAYVIKANGEMLRTPQRIKVTGDDTYGFGVLAGRSEDERIVQVLISNFEIDRSNARPRIDEPCSQSISLRKIFPYKNNQGYELTIKNLPWKNKGYTIHRYRISNTNNYDLLGEASDSGEVFIETNPLPPPSVELITLRYE